MSNSPSASLQLALIAGGSVVTLCIGLQQPAAANDVTRPNGFNAEVSIRSSTPLPSRSPATDQDSSERPTSRRLHWEVEGAQATTAPPPPLIVKAPLELKHKPQPLQSALPRQLTWVVETPAASTYKAASVAITPERPTAASPQPIIRAQQGRSATSTTQGTPVSGAPPQSKTGSDTPSSSVQRIVQFVAEGGRDALLSAFKVTASPQSSLALSTSVQPNAPLQKGLPRYPSWEVEAVTRSPWTRPAAAETATATSAIGPNSSSTTAQHRQLTPQANLVNPSNQEVRPQNLPVARSKQDSNDTPSPIFAITAGGDNQFASGFDMPSPQPLSFTINVVPVAERPVRLEPELPQLPTNNQTVTNTAQQPESIKSSSSPTPLLWPSRALQPQLERPSPSTKAVIRIEPKQLSEAPPSNDAIRTATLPITPEIVTPATRSLESVAAGSHAIIAVSTASSQAQQTAPVITQQNQSSPTPSTAQFPYWELIPAGQESSPSDITREIESAQQAYAKGVELAEATTQDELSGKRSTWIVALGGGTRIGLGEPTYAMAYGRLGYQFSEDWSFSLRPSYVFGNSDSKGIANGQGAFQMPFTIDLFPSSWLSPFAGGGIASNTDSNGKIEAMISGGIDIRISKHVVLTAGINYIFQTSDNNSEKEALTVITFRF